jgi:hypothetical protein
MDAGKPAGRRGAQKLRVEWIYIRYRTIAIGAALLVLGVGVVLWGRFGPSARHGADRSAAESAVKPGEFDDGVRVVRIDGDVRVKRAGQFLWESASDRTVLRAGDQIRTSEGGTAQLLYFDGTAMTVSPDSLLEIRDLWRDATQRRQKVSERLAFGSLSARTQDNAGISSVHEVATEKAAVRARKASEFQLRHDPEKGESEVLSYRGELTLATADEEIQLPQSARATVERGGRVVEVVALLEAPRINFPPDQRSFAAGKEGTVGLGWSEVPGAASYRVQVSDRHHFAQAMRDEGPLKAAGYEFAGLAPGTYYWRVAAIDGKGHDGQWSETRAFRLLGSEFRDASDRQAPPLDVREILVVGTNAIVSGRTEPGSQVWIDGERVDVEDDGKFTWLVRLREYGKNKISFLAQDAAGNETRRVGSAYVDAF